MAPVGSLSRLCGTANYGIGPTGRARWGSPNNGIGPTGRAQTPYNTPDPRRGSIEMGILRMDPPYFMEM
jgi:hypothetical protein